MSGSQNESAFKRLMGKELGDLDVARAGQLADAAKAEQKLRETEAEIVDAGPFTDEPVVASIDRDLFGIALSGGGIRSATFNLGLLQGLENRGLLTNLDYLSTVSGGGYVGGFYSALRATSKDRSSPGGAPKLNEPDSPPVRHLREFSSFLVPRYGLFQAETHRALAHAVRVMAVSLTGSLSLLICAACTWLVFIVFCATHPWFAPFATVELLIIWRRNLFSLD